MTVVVVVPPADSARPVFGASEFIAALALVVSLLALLLPLLRNRRATLAARLEAHRSTGSHPPAGDRVVVVNTGPAIARDLKVELTHKGTPISDGILHMAQSSGPALHPWQEHHMPLVLMMGDQYPDAARLTWTDGRWWLRQPRTETFWLSVQHHG